MLELLKTKTTHRDYFEKIAHHWPDDPERLKRLDRILARFGLTWQCSPTILDLGTGRGALLPLLRPFAPSAQIVALDLAEAMLSYARFRRGQARLVQGDGHRLPFGPGTFKAVICHAVFPHFTDKLAALADIRRVLLPGGTLLIVHEISRAQVNAIHQSAHNSPVQDDHLPPPNEMGSLLNKTGFEVLRVDDAPEHYLAVGQTPSEHG